LRSTTVSSAWSPDSSKISFGSTGEDGTDIYIVSAEGGRPLRLTTDPSEDAVPSWSRDGHWIYFASNRTGEFQTWKVPVEGGEAIQVTRSGGFNARESSDGYLYYTKGDPGEIWKIPIEGGAETPVLRQTLLWYHWALSSEGIYFRAPPQKEGQVWDLHVQFLDFESGEIREVLALNVPGFPDDLTVSPDEQWLFVVLNTPDSGTDLMMVENFR
jgi:Tol biopolymer transport system component